MTIEVAFACVIAFAVALVQASRRTILNTRSIFGPVQIIASVVCAAMVPALTVYALQFHTAWALGLEPDSAWVEKLSMRGLELALVVALALFLVAVATYVVSALLMLAGRRVLGVMPAVFAVGLLLAIPLRGNVGGRFDEGSTPPTMIATAIVLVFLVVAIVAAGRMDSDLER